MEKEEILVITEKDLDNKKLKLEHKEAILSKLRHNYSGRQDSIHKFEGILIGLGIGLIGLVSLSYSKSYGLIIAFILNLILVIFLIFITDLKNKEKFGNQIRIVEENVRKELEKCVESKIKNGKKIIY